MWDSGEFAVCGVGFLCECEGRSEAQRPPLSEMAWKNRNKWDGKIINLSPVVSSPPVG